MSILIYDIGLLIAFVIFFSIFLYRGKKNIKKEGLMLLYKTKWGMNLIDYIGKKYQRSLKALSYVSIVVGYFLMAGMIYMLYLISKIYLFNQEAVRAIKIPPIMPLVPYIDKIAPNLGLPSFYFSYWIIILAVIAITHEFAHGILMRRYKIKIKSTGFAFFPRFFPIFPAAFVEQEEKSMVKAKKFEQMAVLSAGTFANVLTAIVSFIILILIFQIAFSPSGVAFDSYSYSILDTAGISAVNGILIQNVSYNNVLSLMNSEGFNEIKVDDKNYFISKELFEGAKKKKLFDEIGKVVFFDDAPAIKVGLMGAISEVNGEKVRSKEDLQNILLTKSPGEKIEIKTNDGEKILSYELELGARPDDKNVAWLGIGFFENQRTGISGKIYNLISYFKEPYVYYESNEAGLFFYNLFWWLVLISISVAFVNMLPVGIFDGGRFFYLTILGITGNKKISERIFAGITWLFLFLVLLLVLSWMYLLFR